MQGDPRGARDISARERKVGLIDFANCSDRRRLIMQMLTIMCGAKIEEHVRVLLNNLAVKGYTVISDVGGIGQTGMVFGKGVWTDRSKLFLVALDNEHMAAVVTAVKELHGSLLQERHGLEVALKVFLVPCELIV
jgi:nitrogen regulatory protein P-II